MKDGKNNMKGLRQKDNQVEISLSAGNSIIHKVTGVKLELIAIA